MRPSRITQFAVLLLCFASPAASLVVFKSFLQVSPFLDGTNWFLSQDLLYEVPQHGPMIEVPAGFHTDFASIPRPFWSVLPRWGQYGPAAVVHDYLYWDQRCTREEADAVMLLAMTESNVGPFHRTIIHRAVRLGGAFAWRNNRRERLAGRERVLPRPPADPHQTWADHQNKLFESGHRPEPRPAPDPPPDYCSEASALWKARQATF